MGLIHGAGVLADRRIVDQTDAQFQQVLDTKVEGLLHLFEAIDPEALGFLALFSSSTARFGRIGQVAYAAANEYLNKWAQQAAVHLPHCRVVSFNWGPWSGGMVSEYAPADVREGGAHADPPRGRREACPRRDRPSVSRSSACRDRRSGRARVVSHRASAPSSTTVADPAPRNRRLAFRRAINLETLPILADHVIDGHAVLPMAMILEWAAEGALHRNPGLVVCGVDELRLFKGVVLNGLEPATIDILAARAVRRGGDSSSPSSCGGCWTTAGRSFMRGPTSYSPIATRAGRDNWAIGPYRAIRRPERRSTARSCSMGRRCRGSSMSKDPAIERSQAGS